MCEGNRNWIEYDEIAALMEAKPLPTVPSDLLELALNDLEAVEQDPKYRVDMGEWFRYNRTFGHCEVCLAGSVLAKTYELPPTTFVAGMAPARDSDAYWMYALDRMRTGQLVTALCALGCLDNDSCDERMTELHKLQSDLKEETGKKYDQLATQHGIERHELHDIQRRRGEDIVVGYDLSPELFKSQMRTIVARLRELGW